MPECRMVLSLIAWRVAPQESLMLNGNGRSKTILLDPPSTYSTRDIQRIRSLPLVFKPDDFKPRSDDKHWDPQELRWAYPPYSSDAGLFDRGSLLSSEINRRTQEFGVILEVVSNCSVLYPLFVDPVIFARSVFLLNPVLPLSFLSGPRPTNPSCQENLLSPLDGTATKKGNKLTILSKIGRVEIHIPLKINQPKEPTMMEEI